MAKSLLIKDTTVSERAQIARHVDGLKVSNVEFALKKADERPMVVLDDVMNDKLQNITGPNGKIIRKK